MSNPPTREEYRAALSLLRIYAWRWIKRDPAGGRGCSNPDALANTTDAYVAHLESEVERLKTKMEGSYG